MFIIFNEICINEEMMLKYTYIYIYIYTHIDIDIDIYAILSFITEVLPFYC